KPISMSPATLKRSYYPSLDGLRGIAILLVIFHHNFDFIPGSQFGYVGVDLFFVLSGFLITDILLKTRDTKNFIQKFYIRRVLRIFPLYYLILFAFFLFVPFISQLQYQYNYYHDNQSMTWFHMINWLYIFNQRPSDSMIFGHFWSLSVEEQFYILWPFLILLCRNLRKLTVAIYIILGIGIMLRFASWLQWGGNYTGFSFQYMTHYDGLCIGSLIAIWKFDNSPALIKKFIRFLFAVTGISFLVFILAKTFFTGLPHFMLFGYTNVAIIFGLIVISATSMNFNYAKRLLENNALRYFGKISYGLYIFHWPIFLVFRSSFQHSTLFEGVNVTLVQFIIAIASLIVAILISVLSYNLFERRILALKDMLTEDGVFLRLRQKLLLLMRPASAK
ncbi:MAG: acyltransferase, partial [Chitinophagaceae bacterium]